MRSTLLLSLFTPSRSSREAQRNRNNLESRPPLGQDVFAGSVLGVNGSTSTLLVGCSPLSCGSATIINGPKTFNGDMDIYDEVINKVSKTMTAHCDITPTPNPNPKAMGMVGAHCTGSETLDADGVPAVTNSFSDKQTYIATAKVTIQEYIPGVQTPGAAAPTQVATVLGVAGVMAGIGAALL